MTSVNSYNTLSMNTPRVAIALMMRRPIDVGYWLNYHRALGITRFYIRVEDTPDLELYLATQSDVILEKGISDKQGNNYETALERQRVFVNQSIRHAEASGIEWIFNIDSDELLHSDTSSLHPLAFLKQLPSSIKTLKLQNAEAIYDGQEAHGFDAKTFKKCSEPGAKCRAYANGKAGGRAEKGVVASGCHNFHVKTKACIDSTTLYHVPFSQLHVLHFESPSFGVWAEKFLHLGKNSAADIPFAYYHESMEAVEKAYAVYQKHVSLRPENTNAIYQWV